MIIIFLGKGGMIIIICGKRGMIIVVYCHFQLVFFQLDWTCLREEIIDPATSESLTVSQ